MQWCITSNIQLAWLIKLCEVQNMKGMLNGCPQCQKVWNPLLSSSFILPEIQWEKYKLFGLASFNLS